MHVVFNRLAGTFFRCLEQRPHVHVKTEIGKRRSHHLGAAVMPVLPQFADHHARAPAFSFCKVVDFLFQRVPALGRIVSSSVHTSHLLSIGAMAPICFLQRVADFAHRGAQTYRPDGQIQQVAVAFFGGCSQSSQCRRYLLGVAAGADGLQSLNLTVAHAHVVDFQRFNGVF